MAGSAILVAQHLEITIFLKDNSMMEKLAYQTVLMVNKPVQVLDLFVEVKVQTLHALVIPQLVEDVDQQLPFKASSLIVRVIIVQLLIAQQLELDLI